MWYTYILNCCDDTFYTWVTTDLQRRIHEHNYTEKWAKYTKVRRPVTLIHYEEFENRSEACKRESEIKKWVDERKKRY